MLALPEQFLVQLPDGYVGMGNDDTPSGAFQFHDPHDIPARINRRGTMILHGETVSFPLQNHAYPRRTAPLFFISAAPERLLVLRAQIAGYGAGAAVARNRQIPPGFVN